MERGFLMFGVLAFLLGLVLGSVRFLYFGHLDVVFEPFVTLIVNSEPGGALRGAQLLNLIDLVVNSC